MKQTVIRVFKPAGFWHRMAARMIGVGVLLLTERPAQSLRLYFGTYWNVGLWALTEAPVTARDAGSADNP